MSKRTPRHVEDPLPDLTALPGIRPVRTRPAVPESAKEAREAHAPAALRHRVVVAMTSEQYAMLNRFRREMRLRDWEPTVASVARTLSAAVVEAIAPRILAELRSPKAPEQGSVSREEQEEALREAVLAALRTPASTSDHECGR